MKPGSGFLPITLNTASTMFGETHDLPSWAAFLDIENDGGRPLLCDVGYGELIAARTGQRIPIGARSIRITVDSGRNASVSGALARVIVISQDLADRMPPPSDKPNRVFQQRETVIQAAAARLISFRDGVRFASVRFPTVNGTAVGQIFLADTQAKATAAAGIELLPGESFEEWDGPLWVFRPAAAANGELDVIQAVKEFGAFT